MPFRFLIYLMEKAITSGEKSFIEFMMNYIVDSNANEMQTNLEKLSKHMLDTIEAKSDANLYRKQYGNLKQCVLDGAGIL
jgi:hypothetical protein